MSRSSEPTSVGDGLTAPHVEFVPRHSGSNFSLFDTVLMIVGVVVGVGIFRTPSIVAAQFDQPGTVLLMWVVGGAVSLIGALCYAELASTYPHEGGDYHYLYRAFGDSVSFLFAWARMTVIQTGSIALLAFLVGDYASELLRLGTYSSSVYAGLTISLLSGANIAGVHEGKWIQRILLAGLILGIVLLTVAGLGLPPFPITPFAPSLQGGSALGMAMIFILLTYGGWNEASYLSAEVRDPRRNMVRALVISIFVITALYVLINWVLLRGLGLPGMAKSEAVASDLMRLGWGQNGARFISFLVIFAALSTINGTMITGARSNYALGRDFSIFSFLGRWNQDTGAPARGFLVQGMISLLLVLLGTGTRSGFAAMVEYTAPVFWFFFLLAGLSIFTLRRKEPEKTRPFRVPLYPLPPLVFCLVCLYMLRSSLAYTGRGALAGVAVLLAGIPLLWMERKESRKIPGAEKGGRG